MPYPHRQPGVAPGRSLSARGGSSIVVCSPLSLEITLRDAMHVGLASIARRYRTSVRDLSKSDGQFLRDLDRPEIRYPMTALVRLTGIGARAEQPAHREALPQLVRQLMVMQRNALGLEDRPLDVDEAFNEETHRQARFDIAQRRFDHERSPESHAAAIAAGEEQLAWTQESLDALFATEAVSA